MVKITNENLYKYQIECLKELNKIVNQLETKTKENYLIKIGEYKHHFHNGNCWQTEIGDVYLNINEFNWEYRTFSRNFLLDFDLVEGYDNADLDDLFRWDIKIKLDKDVFLKINETINKIFNDNRKRKEFHERLNKELQALNKVLIIE